MRNHARLIRLAAVRGFILTFDETWVSIRHRRPGPLNVADAVDFLADHFPEATVRARNARSMTCDLNISAEPDHGQDHPDC